MFKGNKNNELSKIKNWELVFKPTDSNGELVKILKLKIVDKNTILFLSQNYSIGFYKNDELILLK